MSFEIVEGLGWGAPDWVLVPVGAGGAMTGNWKGYLDLEQLGLIDSKPRMAAVQSTGCAPVIRAYEQHMDPMRIQAWERPESVASGLLDPYPWDGDFAVRGINESHGTAVAVTDREILEAQRLLARSEGVFAEPSGVTSLAGLVKLAAEGKVERADCIVVEITGSGLKDPQIATSAMTQIPVIEPSMAEFARIYQN
jgi:threonine synthase